jgi:hypothetical protein
MTYNKPEVVVTNAIEVIASINKLSNVHFDSSEVPPTRDLTTNAYEADE